MTTERTEVYRDKQGRFTSRYNLLQGPPVPRHIALRKFAREYCKPTYWTKFLRKEPNP